MRTRFITTAPHPEAFPDLGLPEIAFVGRSNVGKSSLLNRLAGAKIARTSKTPGRTQAVNFFEVAGADFAYVLADLPGFGYAKAPKSERRKWYGLIEAYLAERVGLSAVLQLFDLRRAVDPEDADVFRWLLEHAAGRQVMVVGTKADKFPKAKRKPALHAICQALGVPKEAALLSSSTAGLGIEALRTELAQMSVRQKSLDERDFGVR